MIINPVFRLETLVEESAVEHGNELAVRSQAESWSYKELDAWSNRAARWLSSFDVVLGDRVAIWARKSCATIACMQATLRLGAAYVPIDPGTPYERVRAIVRDCDVRVVVTDSFLASGQEPQFDKQVIWLDGRIGSAKSWATVATLSASRLDICSLKTPDDLAYILYTSGSTGRPKGVCISHRNAAAFLHWAVREVKSEATSVFCNYASLQFDISVFELYGAFASGALVSLVPEEIACSAHQLVAFIRSEKITIWYSVPTAMVLMMQGGLLTESLPYLRVAAFAGEAFPIQPLRRIRQQLASVRLFNFFGPTETNVCTCYEILTVPEDPGRSVPIGNAASGDRVWLVKADGSVAQPGEEGELWVEGPTVMLGYWGAPPHEGPYRTGDICRLSEDGTLDFCGRRDRMVKVRGYRIELDEVETVISQHPRVREAAVMIEGEGVSSRLAAYIVPLGSRGPTLIELKEFSATLLPHYMVIERIHIVSEFPRTLSGKVDRMLLAMEFTTTDNSKAIPAAANCGPSNQNNEPC